MVLPAYVGRFEVRNEIGTGGFAVVLRAWDEELECFVALKILHPGLAEDEEFHLRFLEEARLLRRIRSPNVVTVHDVGRLNDGRPYFVMDFADRGTLAPRLERLKGGSGPDPQSVMALVDAVADGVSAIHEAGVVHRDIKPANTLFQLARRGRIDQGSAASRTDRTHAALAGLDERILVSDLGIAKDLVKQAGDATIVAGTPLYQAPEQREPGAEVTPAADVYAATAMLWHVLTGERPPNAKAVPSRVNALPAAWRDAIAQGMASDPKTRFDTMEHWRAAVHEAMAHDTAEIRQALPTEAVPPQAHCPYKGLAAFQPEDARYFFGREALVDEVVRRIQLNRVLVVGGPSGSGKSSLVRAGLIPALNAGALRDSETWRIALFTPGRDPIAELYFQVTSNTPSSTSPVSLEDLLAHPTMARHLGGASRSTQPLVLCIDQFEELFTLAPEAQRGKFVAALSAMTDPADSNVRVVIAVRADFYAVCAQIPWLAERITNNQMLVGPMTGAELRRAIGEPARPAGLHLERGLMEAIIGEAGNEAGSLPLVAHALVETWLRREGNTLTLAGFQAAGGVAGAISQTADVTYEHQFDAAEREATQRLFLRLVTPGEGTADTRKALPLSEIDTYPNPQTMHRVVESLTEARLLTVDDTNVQIAHEALLRTWPRLRTWIEESRDELRMRQRISRAAAEWDAEGRDSDLLYRGTPLLSGLEWAAKNPDQMGELERTFLDASAETKAMAEAISAERERRTRRVRRVAITLLSTLAVGATLASANAFFALREARVNEEKAALALREAQLNEQKAAAATTEAHERFAGALGSAARGLVDTDPLLALVLGAEAIARAEVNPPGFAARAAMVAARRVLDRGGPFLVGSPIAAGDAYAMAMRPDGSLLASAQRDGRILLIDTATRRQVGPSLEGHVGGVRDIAFGPDGRRLASGGADGTVRLWEVGDGLASEGTILGKAGDVISGVCVSPRGEVVASANGDGTVRLWDGGRGVPVGPPIIERPLGFNTVEFSPDGRGLVASYSDGAIFAWALPSREPLFAPLDDVHTSTLLHLAFSPTGEHFATVSTDGTSTVIEFPSGRVVGPAFGDSVEIGAAAFTPDGRVLIGGGADGALKLWDVHERRILTSTPSGHTQAIIAAELTNDGAMMTTLGRDQLIRTWRTRSSYPLAQEKKVHGRSAKGVAFSADGKRLASGDDSGRIQLWELDTSGHPIVLSGHGHQVWALAFSVDGTWLASGDRAGEVRLWDAADATMVRSIEAHDTAVWWLGFTSDGEHLVTAGEMQVRIWDVETGERVAQLAHGEARVTRAALSPDDSLLAVASTDGAVRLWQVATESMIKEIAVEDDVVWSVTFSPDGGQLATASSDEVVAVWDAQTGRQQASLTGHVGGAADVAYLADGVTLLATDRSGGLHMWDARSGRRLVDTWQAHAGASWRLAIHPDGERFATAGDDGWVRVWDELSIERACDIGAHAFDAVRREQYLGAGERSVACD